MKNINFDQLAHDLDSIKMDTLGKVGQQDANYIRSVVKKQRLCEWSGRILLMLGFIQPLVAEILFRLNGQSYHKNNLPSLARASAVG